MNVRLILLLCLSLAGLFPLSMYGQPLNDNLAQADTIAIGDTICGTTLGSGFQGTSPTIEPTSPCMVGFQTVWYQISTATPDIISISLTPSSTGGTTAFDLSLYKYEGPLNDFEPSDFCEVLCQGGSAATGHVTSLDTVALQPNTTYYLQVTSWFPTLAGPFCISVESVNGVNPPAQVPVNDEACGAIPLIIDSCLLGDNTNATFNTGFNNVAFSTTCGEPRPNCFSGADRSVWYSITPPPNGNIKIVTQSGTLDATDIDLALYEFDNIFFTAPWDANTCNNFSQYIFLQCSTEVLVAANLDPNKTYFLQVSGAELVDSTGAIGGAEGTFCIELQEISEPDPGEDPCQPETVLVGNNDVHLFDASLARQEPDDALLPLPTSWADSTIDSSYWLVFQAPPSGKVRVNLCHPETKGNTQVAVYFAHPDSCFDYSTFELLADNDDILWECNGNTLAPRLEVGCLTPGEDYFILVDGFLGSPGAFGISIDSLPDDPPMITATTFAPSCAGASDGYILAEVSLGTPPYSFSWANSNDTLKALYGLAAGAYTLTVTDACGVSSMQTIDVDSASAVSINAGIGDTACYAGGATLTLGVPIAVQGENLLESNRVFILEDDAIGDMLNLLSHNPRQVLLNTLLTDVDLPGQQRVYGGDRDTSDNFLYVLSHAFTNFQEVHQIWEVDINTGSRNQVAELVNPGPVFMTGLAFHPQQKVFYAIGFDQNSLMGQLYELNPFSGDSTTVKRVVSLDIERPVYLSISPEGEWITQGRNPQLIYRIQPFSNTATSTTTTVVGELPFSTASYAQDADFDPSTGRFYIYANNALTGHPALISYDLDAAQGFTVPGYEGLQNGGAIAINPRQGVYDYTWSASPSTGVFFDDATLANPVASFTASDYYTFTLEVDYGCSNTQTATVQYGVSVGPSITLTQDSAAFDSANGSIMVQVVGGLPSYTYVWSIGNDTLETISGPTATGLAGDTTYTISVTDAVGCEAVDSVRLGEMAMVSIRSLNSLQSFALYPNPNGGRFTIDVQMRKPETVQLSLFSATGKQVWQSRYPSTASLKESFSLNELPKGIYVLQLRTETGIASRKVVIQ